ncbi:recombinase family protein [Magnetospirillum fulvum]|uniref:Resolvase, N terminal domain n=1 Tax=Magnetospirillum fulvum TaxID=1082 RepID=A0A1H6I584_MAGFU|nr:Resolvase, N terminal domain [Magnetospirillum fulvum]
MTRVVLYARYSSDNQSVSSIEDQVRICRERAEREKWAVGATYQDAAISGASITLRPGILNNELYVGVLVWNRLRYTRHHRR